MSAFSEETTKLMFNNKKRVHDERIQFFDKYLERKQ